MARRARRFQFDANKSSPLSMQICLQVAAITALRGETVLYIDTTGNFSSKRVSAMIAAAVSRNPVSLNTEFDVQPFEAVAHPP